MAWIAHKLISVFVLELPGTGYRIFCCHTCPCFLCSNISRVSNLSLLLPTKGTAVIVPDDLVNDDDGLM